MPDGETGAAPSTVYPYARPSRTSRVRRAVTAVGRALHLAHAADADVDAEPGSLEAVPGWGEAPDGTGICLSGGGIRSASFCLGALQSFERHGLLFGDRAAKYLSAVSGGSYIATAFTMVASGQVGAPVRGDKQVTLTPPRGIEDDGQDLRTFAPGTPEVRLLRNRTLYLTHGKGKIPAVIWRLLLGVIFNVLLVSLLLAAIAVPVGWFYGWRWPSLRAGCPEHCPAPGPYSTPSWIWIAIAATAVLAVLTGFVWLAWRFKEGWAHAAAGAVSMTLVVVALAGLLFLVGIPWVISLARPYYVATSAVPSTSHTAKASTLLAASTGMLALLGTWIAAGRRLLARPPAAVSGVTKVLRNFTARHKSMIMTVAATIAGPILMLASITIYAYWGAAYLPSSSGPGLASLCAWAGATLLLAAIWTRADVTVWSLYPIYRSRLAAAFVTRRIQHRADVPSSTAVGDQDADERPTAGHYCMTDFQPEQYPQLIVCASANISDYGATPSGSRVTSFTFSGKQIGGPLVGAVPTEAYERAVLGASGDKERGTPQSRYTTLPTAMAISSAAVSPSMGRDTRPAFRLYLALANIRLGVWVPNPRRLELFRHRRAWNMLLPRPQYLLREILGRNHIDLPFLYVTDGGHYENLGLVELLRRKCRVIWCIDASGDQVNTFQTLGGALQTASAELQVSVDINPEADMAPPGPRPDNGDPWYVKEAYCKGTITYADGTTGTLVVVKAGVPENAPWSVVSYAEAHPKFPCDSTADQLYGAVQFDAYRSLGEFSVDEAVHALGIDPG